MRVFSVQEKGNCGIYIPHAQLPPWTCFKSIVMWMAAAWIQQSSQEKHYVSVALSFSITDKSDGFTPVNNFSDTKHPQFEILV